MQVTVDDVNSVKKTLHIEIPEQDVRREVDKAYQDLKKTAKIKGFRPGKVPRSVLENRFKKEINADVSTRLIQESLIAAIREKELNVVGSPQLDPPELTGDGPYRYSATVEIKPEIPDIDYKGLPLKRARYTVSEEEIETQLKMLQKNLATREPIDEDRPVRQDDFILIDYEGRENGQAVSELQRTEGFMLQVGGGMITADFDEQLIGMVKGEQKDITVTFPEDYYNKKLAGRTILFDVTLQDIRKEVLPAIDDDMARKTGEYENLGELKAQITAHLTSGYDKRAEQELNEQAFSQLLETVTFEVPDSMVESELDVIVSDAERSFAYHNMSMEEVGVTQASLREKYRDTALKQARRHLILAKIIDQEQLELSDSELEAGYAEMARAVGQPAEEIAAYYRQNPDRQAFFKHTLLEKKASKLIIGSGSIEDVTPKLETESDPEPTEGAAED